MEIEKEGFLGGLSIILGISNSNPKRELEYLDILFERRVDGIIFVDAAIDADHVQFAKSSNIPIVVIEGKKSGSNVFCIQSDSFGGAYKATSYLAELGHQRIACISGPSYLKPQQRRIDGYTSSLASASLQFEEDLLIEGNFKFGSGFISAKKLVKLDSPPSAIFCCSDMMALGAISALRGEGIKVPEDVSIIGYDNIAQSARSEPQLSTISQHKDLISKVALDLILERNKHSELLIGEKYIVETDLIIRSSAAIPKFDIGQ